MIREIHIPTKRASDREFITGAEFFRCLRGLQAANLSGMVLNGMVTVSWQATKLETDVEAEEAHRQFKSLLDHWLSARMEHAAFIWVMERGETLGLHSHYLLHVPEEHRRDFKYWAPRGVSTVLRRPLVSYCLPDGKEVHPVLSTTRRPKDVVFQRRQFRYLMKGIDPYAIMSTGEADNVSIPASYKIAPIRQGRVPFKRSGQNRFLQATSATRVAARFGGWGEIDSMEPLSDAYLKQFELEEMRAWVDKLEEQGRRPF